MTEQRPYATGGPVPAGADMRDAVKPGCAIPLPDDRDTFLRLFAEEFNSAWHPIALGHQEEPR